MADSAPSPVSGAGDRAADPPTEAPTDALAERPYHPARIRLHVVTGKGGTGKTTVAAALALALAAGGRRTLLCEVEGRQGIAQLFDVPPLPYDERKIAVAQDGGDVFALAVEPKAALLEYLDLFYRMGRAGKVLERIGAVDFATTVAPGLRDVLLTGKVYEAARRRRHQGPVYDAVVLDAPPTGRVTRFLNVNEEVADLAKVGPIRNQADSIMTLMRSPQTAVHLVSVLEEMPVQETQDAAAGLRTAGLPLGCVIVNMVREPVLADADLVRAAAGRLDVAEVAEGLVAAGIGARSARRGSSLDDARIARLAAGLVREGTDHALRVELEHDQRNELAAVGRPTAELPALPGGIDLGALYDLADLLVEQGVA
ncbi:MAG TPA: ArsA-related P-loop ATPase [Kineosporiaceae bacterium]|nr:ArsA-related P-loop ATPase [Kineosporiaceae bacterium]